LTQTTPDGHETDTGQAPGRRRTGPQGARPGRGPGGHQLDGRPWPGRLPLGARAPAHRAAGVGAAAAVRAHRRRAVERALACATTLPDHAYILSPEPDGSAPYHPSWATQAYGRARARATADGVVGLAGVRFYDFRHFMGSEMLAAGVPISVVAERMGNSARTMDLHYRHAVPAADRAAADTMDTIMGRATQPRRVRRG